MHLVMLVCAHQVRAATRVARRSKPASALLTTRHMCLLLQVNGHFAATLDPLGLDARPKNLELDPASYGFTEADLDRE